MCGIIAILGQEPVAVRLLEALKRLEYRGYDFAGVATLEDGQLCRRRSEGKLKNLEVRLAREPLSGHAGIGHTRWATHGRPTGPMRTRMRPGAWRWFTTALSRISVNCGRNWPHSGPSLRPRLTAKSSPTW